MRGPTNSGPCQMEQSSSTSEPKDLMKDTLQQMTEGQQKEHCPCCWGQTSKQEAQHNALTLEVKHTKEEDFRLATIIWRASEIPPVSCITEISPSARPVFMEELKNCAPWQFYEKRNWQSCGDIDQSGAIFLPAGRRTIANDVLTAIFLVQISQLLQLNVLKYTELWKLYTSL